MRNWNIFEGITRKIYDIILSDHQRKIEHNIKLEGKSKIKHQIDVYVQIFLPLITIRDIIDCKHWNSNVKKSQVEALDSIKNDLNANRATIVSRKGFQKGAIKYARFCGINLYKILTPTELDVHTLVHKRQGMINEIVGLTIQLEAKTPEQLKDKFTKEHRKNNYNELTIYNVKGEPVTNIFDLVDNSFMTLQKQPESGLKAKVDFLNNYMLINSKKEKVQFVEIHLQKKFIETEKEEYIKDTKLFVHDVVNDKIFPVDKPVGFDLLK